MTRDFRRRPAVSKILSFLPFHSASRPIEFAGDAGLGAGQEAILPKDAVDERGLACIRPAQNGDAQGLGEIELAPVLFFAQDERLGLALLVGVEARRGRQDLDEFVIELAQALAVLGRESDRLAKAETERLIDARLARGALRFVGDDDDRLAGAAHGLREMPVGGGEAGARVDHEQDRVAIHERRFRLRAHAPGERLRIALLETRGVDDGEREIGEPRFALAAVAGDAGLVVDQRKLAADQPIEQSRLADIRPADDRDLGAHNLPVGNGLILRWPRESGALEGWSSQRRRSRELARPSSPFQAAARRLRTRLQMAVAAIVTQGSLALMLFQPGAAGAAVTSPQPTGSKR